LIADDGVRPDPPQISNLLFNISVDNDYTPAMADHDHSYKQLFSHTELVRDLLVGFVRGGVD